MLFYLGVVKKKIKGCKNKQELQKTLGILRKLKMAFGRR